MITSTRRSFTKVIVLCVLLSLTESCFSLLTPLPSLRTTIRTRAIANTNCCSHGEDESSGLRRNLLFSFVPIASILFGSNEHALAAADLSSNLKEARRQLDAVPKLIDDQKWDSVRAILVTPPLKDCWTTNTKMLREYAESVDDELAALEAREEVVNHLRFLDMAVYNNVFNPIATEGTAGATKELVRSYYEDPINEWKASVSALDELIQLGN